MVLYNTVVKPFFIKTELMCNVFLTVIYVEKIHVLGRNSDGTGKKIEYTLIYNNIILLILL